MKFSFLGFFLLRSIVSIRADWDLGFRIVLIFELCPAFSCFVNFGAYGVGFLIWRGCVGATLIMGMLRSFFFLCINVLV